MSGNLIPEHFVEKLFNQVKESSEKNSDSIDRLTENISKFADVLKNVSSQDIPQIKSKCDDIISISDNIKRENEEIFNFLSKYSGGFKKLNDFELDSYRSERVEMMKILRWLSLKFKIIIAIVTIFFLLTGGSYIVVKYFSHKESNEIISMIREENNNLIDHLRKENKQMKNEIMSENQKFREEIIKKIKSFHPDFDVRIDK
jgi:predicted PurR-regulated permease PerM